MKELIGSVVRHGSTTIGGGLAVGGTCTVDTTQQALGAGLALIGFALSVWKRQKTA